MKLHLPLILASRSPRRRKLLDQLGWPFEVIVHDTEERILPGLAPAEIVRHLAWEKAAPVSRQHPDALTLAADTLVVHRDKVLGKPADADEARAMLRRLSGNTHTVYTGIALSHPASGRCVAVAEATRVTFGALTDAEIDAYVATGSPMDKAGAYGIQEEYGAVFVAHIEGDYFNVVGLPLHRLYHTLRHEFPDVLDV